MIRLVPPIAVPFGPIEIARSVVGGTAAPFGSELAQRLGRQRVELHGSGRSGLARYLAQVASDDRDEVVVPAYTCWSVAAAVVRAGCRLRPVDIDPETFRFDVAGLRRAVGPRTAAVIVAQLIAPTVDVAEVVREVRDLEPGARVIEDAAQAWPETRSTADAVLLSFGRGKPLPLGGGGALAHDEPTQARDADPVPGALSEAVRLAATCVLSHPSLYRVPSAIPALEVGTTTFDPDFEDSSRFRPWQARLGIRLLDRVPSWIDQRSRNARWLRERLSGHGALRWPAAASARGPLRLPLLAPSREIRDRLARALRGHGVSASAMYPADLARIPGIEVHLAEPTPALRGAETLVDRLITLPIYPGLGESGLESIAIAFERSMTVAGA